jgi:hypothetical protein
MSNDEEKRVWPEVVCASGGATEFDIRHACFVIATQARCEHRG